VGAAGRGDCEDFADGFLGWLLAEIQREEKAESSLRSLRGSGQS
jgi:hypothetical protein